MSPMPSPPAPAAPSPFHGTHRTSSFRFGLSLQADLAAAPHSFQPSTALSPRQTLRAAAIAGPGLSLEETVLLLG